MNRYRVVPMDESCAIEFSADGFDVENGYVVFYRRVEKKVDELSVVVHRQELSAFYHPKSVKLVEDDHVAG